MKKYVYVRCEVSKPDPQRASLFNTLYSFSSGQAIPDIPEIDPGRLSFSHMFLEAESVEDAYSKGSGSMRDFSPDGLFMNDYVIELEGEK